MPQDRDALLDLDPRTARIGREFYADVRRRDAAERAEARRPPPPRTSGSDDPGDGPFAWLFGGSDDAYAGDDGGDG